jgi:cell division protein FtsB
MLPTQHHMATVTPPLRLQQAAPKPSIFRSDSDSQHSFTYLCEFPESSTLISLIFVAKSEFSHILANPTTRNATKPRQLRAPWPKQSGNAFQALVDVPEDGSDPTFDGRDGIVDGTDNNTVVIANPHDSGPPASQQLEHNVSVEDNIVLLSNQINDCEAMHYKNQQCLYDIEMRVIGLSNN